MWRTNIFRFAALVAMLITGGAFQHIASAVEPVKTQNTTPLSTQSQAKSPEYDMLVFINPNGRPCQMQIAILDSMSRQLEQHVRVTYIKTTEPQDRQTFYRYGIRGLPSMLIADKKGDIVKRLSPGIQSGHTIMSAVHEITGTKK